MSFDGIMWRRLKYMLSPQIDLYRNIRTLMDLEYRINPMHVVDVGCGNGVGTQLLYNADATVLGIDSDERAIDFAKSLFPHCGWSVLDITDESARSATLQVGIGGEPQVWNCMTCIETIEHLPSREDAARFIRWASTISPDLFICSTINKDAEYRKSDEHKHGWNAAEFANLFKKNWAGTFSLYDYTLEERVSDGSTRTPLVAVCKR